MKQKQIIYTTVLYCLFCITFGISSSLAAGETTDKKCSLKQVWESEKGLKVPESVLFDNERNIIYVSNINGKPREKNGQGFISKMSLSGKIEFLAWVSGLNAPKGMAIFKDNLYVTDIDHVVKIDLNTGKIVKKIPVPGSSFLNDVAADKSGNIYVSDSSTKNSVVYKITNGQVAEWLKQDEINRPNGLFVEGNHLLVGNSGDKYLKTVALDSRQVMPVSHVGSNIDGIHPDGKGNYFCSDWKGKTFMITSSGQTVLLMDTTSSKINSADLEYIESQRLLLIPTFFDNRVVAYRVQ